MDDFERDFEEFLVADTDPEPYLFEPEHTDEELHVFDAEQARREAESSAPILLHRMGFGATAAIVGEIYHQEENRRRECITRSENFAAITNPGVFSMLVWILVGGTDYFDVSALCWVMFVAILCWVLTVCLFIIYVTGTHSRIPQSLCLNCSAAALYLVTAVADAFSVNQAIGGRHNYNCWAASAFFAFLTTLCYAGSSYLSYCAWKTTEEGQ